MLSRLNGDSGTVYFNAVTNESVEMRNRITSYAVEDGQDVSDHISPEQDSIPISGVVVGEDSFQQLTILRAFRNNKEVLTFIGRNAMYGVVIESLTTQHNANTRDGFQFNITLKRIRVSRVQEIQIAIPQPAIANTTQTKPVQSKGTQQPAQKEPFFTFQPRGS